MSQCSAEGQHGDSFWRGCEASQLLRTDSIVVWIEAHNTIMCRIKSIYFIARGNVRAYMVLDTTWHKCLCFTFPDRGTDPPSGVSHTVWSPSPSAGARSTAIVWAGAAVLLCPMRPRGTEHPTGFSYSSSRYLIEETPVPAARLLHSQAAICHQCFYLSLLMHNQKPHPSCFDPSFPTTLMAGTPKEK